MNDLQIPAVHRELKWLSQSYGERKRTIEKVLPDLNHEERRSIVISLGKNLTLEIEQIIAKINAGEYDVNAKSMEVEIDAEL